MARGPGGIDLIEPGGGGGIQEIAKPVNAPNFAGMYAEATRAALEPARFYWSTYADSAKQALEESRLQEYTRANLAKEADDRAKNDIEDARSKETIRHNMEDEKQSDRRATAEERRLDIEAQIRDNAAKAEETRAKSEAARSELESAQAKKINTQLDMQTDQYKKVQHDQDLFNDFIKKVGGGQYMPTQFYGLNENPYLARIINETSDGMQTLEGHKMLEEYEAGQNALGREVAARREMGGWDQGAKDVFQDNFNKIAREHPELTAPERFFQAIQQGRLEQQRIDLRGKWTTPDAWQAYNNGIQNGLTPVQAMAAGTDAEKDATSKPVPTKLSADDIRTIVTPRIKPNPGESKEDLAARIEQAVAQGVTLQNTRPAEFNQFIKSLYPTTALKPGETPAQAFARSLLGEQATTGGGTLSQQESMKKLMRTGVWEPPAPTKEFPGGPGVLSTWSPGMIGGPPPAAAPPPGAPPVVAPTPAPGSIEARRSEHEGYVGSLAGKAMDFLKGQAQRPFGIPLTTGSNPRFEPDSWFNPWPRDAQGNMIKEDDGGRPVGSMAGAVSSGGGGGSAGE
jgi:hypothetical protein